MAEQHRHGPDGKLYTAPYNATDILVIDPVAGTLLPGADLSGRPNGGIATNPTASCTA